MLVKLHKKTAFGKESHSHHYFQAVPLNLWKTLFKAYPTNSLYKLRFLQPAIGTFSRHGSIHTMHELHVHAYGWHQKTVLFVSHEYNNITLGSENHFVRFVQWNFV